MSNLLESLIQNLHGYKAQNLTSFPTDDGIAWSAEIVKDGIKVLYAYNRGDGGETSYNVLNPALFKQFEALAKDLYEIESVGQLSGLIADSTENFDRIKQQCINQTLIEVKGDQSGEYRIVPRKLNDSVRVKIRSLYGQDLICIINDQLVEFSKQGSLS